MLCYLRLIYISYKICFFFLHLPCIDLDTVLFLVLYDFVSLVMKVAGGETEVLLLWLCQSLFILPSFVIRLVSPLLYHLGSSYLFFSLIMVRTCQPGMHFLTLSYYSLSTDV